VVAVVVSNSYTHAGIPGGGLDGAKLGGIESAGFLHKDVFAGLGGGEGDRGERRVERGDDHCIDGGVREHHVEIGDCFAAWGDLGQIGGAIAVEVARVKQACGLEICGSFATDEAATDNSKPEEVLWLVTHKGRSLS
jgi:hypothetical protein